MELPPDSRWANFAGGLDAAGRPAPMALEHVRSLAGSFEDTVPALPDVGALSLLRTSRSLMVQAWFDYELLVQACLVSLQAVEAAFREVAYPNKNPRTPFKNLVDLAERDHLVSPMAADRVRTGVMLRNHLAHPTGQRLYSPGMAAGVILASHEIVRDLLQEAGAEGHP